MSRYYVLPNVSINTLVVGGKGPYGTAPFDYRLRPKTYQKERCQCYHSKREPYPRRAMLCDQNYQYYSSSEQLLRDKVNNINYETERQIRRGKRRADIRKQSVCTKNWYLTGGSYCRGPRGYGGLRSRAGD